MGKTPGWALDPFKRFLDYLTDSDNIRHFSREGISRLRHLPGAVEAYRKAVDALAGTDEGRELGSDLMSQQEAEKFAAFAQAETERDFPLLHAHTLIGIWSAFEATIENVLVSFLINEPLLLRNEAFSKTRIPLADFELLEREERMRLLIGEFEKRSGLSRKHGVDRFEGLLESIGLSGAADPDVKRNFLEMHHLRNVLIHRGGEADRRIVEGCPWLSLRLGQHLTVGSDSLKRYQGAMGSYTAELICRISARFGHEIRGELGGKDTG